MPSYTVTAHNSATESENEIHDDTVAGRYGFAGGLVPGATLFAYLARPVVEALGRRWLGDGRMDARFVAPVYEGEPVTGTVADDGTLTLTNAGGTACATGTAALGDGHQPFSPDIPAAELPTRRPPAGPDSLAPGTVLGTVESRYDDETARGYLDQLGDDLPLFRDEGYAHPGWLLHRANDALVANVVLGPWIHVESRTWLLRPVRVGERVRTRARVADLAERKGHRFVDLDVAVHADGEPAMAIRHVAIYQPRRAASG